MNKLVITAITLGLFVLLYLINTSTITTIDGIYGKYANGYYRGENGVENFKSLNPRSLGEDMSKQDGVKLTNCPESRWRKSPSNESLINGNMFTPQGHAMPLNSNVSSSLYSVNAVSTDGDSDSKQSLFMFSNNQCKPECCPSTYSCSGGCVCSTKKQRGFIQNRGTNNINNLESI